MSDQVKERPSYGEILEKNEKTRAKHNHELLYDWEVEARNRIRTLIKNDDEAMAFLDNLIEFAIIKNSCAGR